MMRGFGWFSDRELAQTALQHPILLHYQAYTRISETSDSVATQTHQYALLRVDNLTIRFRFLSSTASACCRLSQLASVRIHRPIRPARVDPPHAKSSTADTRMRSRRIATRNWFASASARRTRARAGTTPSRVRLVSHRPGSVRVRVSRSCRPPVQFVPVRRRLSGRHRLPRGPGR